jgi:hypothetical protein
MRCTLQSAAKLKAHWRHQIVRRRALHWIESRKGLVSVAFVDQSRSGARFVEINSLLIFVLYEDEIHHSGGGARTRVALRLAAYRASRIAHGVLWGGTENSVLHKDLMLAPNAYARGQRIDIRKADLLRLGFDLDSWLSLAARHPGLRRPHLRLPRLWAGFRSHIAADLQGEGPEFEKVCMRPGLDAKAALEASAQDFERLKLYPLSWISQRLDEAVAVFAQLGSIPKRQVAKVARFPEDLRGFWEASEFDFYSSRFRRLPTQSLNSSVENGHCAGAPSGPLSEPHVLSGTESELPLPTIVTM